MNKEPYCNTLLLNQGSAEPLGSHLTIHKFTFDCKSSSGKNIKIIFEIIRKKTLK